MRVRIATLLALLCLATQSVSAQEKSKFCDGFAEGWKAVRGSLAIVPICPIEPITPAGSTSYREGIKAGMRAGQRAGEKLSGGGAETEATRGSFCDGFAEGWKTIKGDLSIVPVCPIALITPIGSTPYREGMKAGIAKARALAVVTRIAVSTHRQRGGRRVRVMSGVLLGGILGGFVGYTVGKENARDGLFPELEAIDDAFVGALIGAIVGGTIGATLKREK